MIMEYNEVLKELDTYRVKTEERYLNEIAEHILNGIKEFGCADIISDEKTMVIKRSSFDWLCEIFVPQRIFLVIYGRLARDFNVTHLRRDVYRITLK